MALLDFIWDNAYSFVIAVIILTVMVVAGQTIIGKQKADIAADADLGTNSSAYDAATQGETNLSEVNESTELLVSVGILVLVVLAILYIRRVNQ